MSQAKTKTLFAQTILGKIFGTKWRNPVKLDRKRKFQYLLLRFFDCYRQSLISGRETPPKFEVFLIFPYFLRS